MVLWTLFFVVEVVRTGNFDGFCVDFVEVEQCAGSFDGRRDDREEDDAVGLETT